MDPDAKLIFVSIAAYRDLQLVPTILDCLAKASFTDRLRFGVCWQHGAEETSLPFSDDSRFRVLDIDYRDSRGACWARAEIMKLWQGEDWFLQVDSHCRFAAGWDEVMLRIVRESGSARPILTTYASPFVPARQPGEVEQLNNSPMLIVLGGFSGDGFPLLKPVPIEIWNYGPKPVRARFIAAGFLFAAASFVTEIGYDPDLYFFGEEIALTVRAFTHGYDIFHPCESIVWHDYVRKDATRHWDDHKEDGAARQLSPNQVEQNHIAPIHIEQDWGELDRKSRGKIRRLLSGEPVESHGLGSVRTLQDYESYAGLSFELRKAQTYTVRGGEPPNTEADLSWASAIQDWMVRIHFDRAELSEGAFEPGAFWCVGVHDSIGAEIYRRDVQRKELEALAGDEPTIVIVCELQSSVLPESWSVWPVSRSQGWLRRLSGKLTDDDYAVVDDEEE